jgi:hypothetical protein
VSSFDPNSDSDDSAVILDTDSCSGSSSNLDRCLSYGIEPLWRGLFANVAQAIDASVQGAFDSLRVGNATQRAGEIGDIDAATEWLIRSRIALVPSFADLVRARGGAVPANIAALLGLPVDANVSALVDAALEASQTTGVLDSRALVALRLMEVYPGGIEQVDALVGMLAEQPLDPLSSSLGPTLANCITDQLRRVRIADRFWWENGFVNESELAPAGNVDSSLLRYLMIANYDFGQSSANDGKSVNFGTLSVPNEFVDALAVVNKFVNNTMTGGAARATRLAFQISGTYDASTHEFGSTPNCFDYSLALTDPANNGLYQVPTEVTTLRMAETKVASLTNADVLSLIGAVGATTASFGGLSMSWRPGRVDLKPTDSEASLCPMHGSLPDAYLGDAFPHQTTLAAFRAKFQRQGFNNRETVALLGAQLSIFDGNISLVSHTHT